MNLQSILSNFSNAPAPQGSNNESEQSSPLGGLSSMLPGGLAGGAAAGGVIALLMGSKSTRKMAKKVVKYGGSAVLGGLAYKAYGNWQNNKALDQTQAITDNDIQQANASIPSQLPESRVSLDMVLITAMIAATKADGQIDSQEQKRLFDAIGKLNMNAEEKAGVFDTMARDITVQEIADSVTLDEHKAEVYLSAYLAIEVDDQLERAFLHKLATALDLPEGIAAYLEQQANQGVVI
ncbi:MAG: uncharacterized membrane protein YebE (DUF533 family) [Cryomorphaceae bacterium]|jgi:uncharacterized membrane protein YebE (DUF533 family)